MLKCFASAASAAWTPAVGSACIVAAAMGVGAFVLSRAGREHRVLDPLVVATDLEPDDMLALLHLRMRGVQPSALIVGEGNVHRKVQRAQVYTSLLGWKGTTVVAGVGSSKLFVGDAEDLLLPGVRDVVPAVEACIPSDSASWVSILHKLVTRPDFKRSDMFPTPTLLYLKPPRELKLAQAQDPAAAAALFAGVTLAIYGSFNLREVDYSSILPWLNPGTTPFHRVILFENYGGFLGNMKTLTRKNMAHPHGGSGPPHRPLPEADSLLGLYCQCVRSVTQRWDAHILRDCSETCEAIETIPGWRDDPKRVEDHRRNKTCIDAVSPNAGQQVAAADPVLVAAITSRRPVYAIASVTIPEGTSYPQVTLGKIGEDDEEMKWELSDAFRAAFGIAPDPTPQTPAA